MVCPLLFLKKIFRTHYFESKQYMNWIIKNKEWLFSGAGWAAVVFTLAFLANQIRAIVNRRKFSKKNSLSGEWCERWWVSSDNYPDANEDPNVIIKQTGNRVFTTCRSGGDTYVVEGTLNSQRFLTGTWGDIEKGTTYHGAFQLRISPKWDTMEGIWIGFDTDSSFKSGKWQWKRASVADYPDRTQHNHVHHSNNGCDAPTK